MLQNLPRPLIVFASLVLGVALIFVIQEPHSVCDSQLEVLKESQAGQIYSRTIKNQTRPPLYGRYLEACKLGNSPGACYEFFNLLKKLNRDLSIAPQECLAEFGMEVPIKRAIYEGIEMMALLAWGDQPPERGLDKLGWFETPDLALYCGLRAQFMKIYGQESWTEFVRGVNKKLPGEAPQFIGGECTNCTNIKRASETMGVEEIWLRSIFSLRCEQYL